MADYKQAAVTAAFTIITSILLYLLKLLVDGAWLKYVREYKDLKREIAYVLVKYANVYSNVALREKQNPLYDTASDALREIAAKTASFVEIRPRYCPGVPKKAALKKVSANLIGLSNGLYENKEFIGDQINENCNLRKEIKAFLKLEK